MDSNQLTLVLLAPVLGVTVGLLAGGKLSRLSDTGLDGWWMLWLATLVQLGIYLMPEVELPVPTLYLVFAFVLAWIVMNAVRQSGYGRNVLILIAAGLTSNLLPIIANGRMPFSVEAALRAGISEQQMSEPVNLIKNYPADSNTRFPWLGDVVPIPPIEKVVSIGDILIVVGVTALIAAVMTGRMPAVMDPDDSKQASVSENPRTADTPRPKAG